MEFFSQRWNFSGILTATLPCSLQLRALKRRSLARQKASPSPAPLRPDPAGRGPLSFPVWLLPCRCSRAAAQPAPSAGFSALLAVSASESPLHVRVSVADKKSRINVRFVEACSVTGGLCNQRVQQRWCSRSSFQLFSARTTSAVLAESRPCP